MVNGVDLVGACIGYGDSEDLSPSRAKPGDHLVGLASSGIHSNGLTLARKSVKEAGMDFHDEFRDSTVGETLLEPTEIYVEPVLKSYRENLVKAAAHVTGGGLENLERMGPNAYRITDPPEPQPVFDLVQESGEVPDRKMYRTFNMGTGTVLATENPERVKEIARETGHEPFTIGTVRQGEGVAVKGIGEV